VRTGVRRWFLVAFFFTLPMVARAEWQAVEKVQAYAIAGKSGPELYASIGERGPVVRGKLRTIAHTNFTLTWSRKYAQEGDACTLVSARPKLTITYTLPKPAEQLSGSNRRIWGVFATGIEDHERIHGDLIKRLVKEIEAATVGMSVAGDPKCLKIKTELKKRLSELFQAHQQRNRDFERAEMSEGGNIHQLILGLVNGR
jgi:predicted secreted Zn-dependent protease